MMSPEFFGERFCVSTSANRDRAKAHLARELNTQMAQPANALHCYHIARRCSGVAHGVEHGDAGAKQRPGLVCRQIVGHDRNRLSRDDYIFRVPAVEADPGNLFEMAENEMAPATRVTLKTVSAVPADAHSLSGFPLRDVRPNRVDTPGNLVARNARILQSGKT